MSTRYASRLTAADKDRMRRAVRTTIATWGEHAFDAADRLTLERIAAHAIGCPIYSLHETELDWIGAMITAAEIVADDQFFYRNERLARGTVGHTTTSR